VSKLECSEDQPDPSPHAREDPAGRGLNARAFHISWEVNHLDPTTHTIGNQWQITFKSDRFGGAAWLKRDNVIHCFLLRYYSVSIGHLLPIFPLVNHLPGNHHTMCAYQVLIEQCHYPTCETNDAYQNPQNKSSHKESSVSAKHLYPEGGPMYRSRCLIRVRARGMRHVHLLHTQSLLRRYGT
jgi:hypothetical protein